MLEFMRVGGVGMWFVLAFGLLSLGSAARFSMSPDPKRVEAVRSLTWATLFSIAASVVAGFSAVGSKVPANPEWAASPKIRSHHHGRHQRITGGRHPRVRPFVPDLDGDGSRPPPLGGGRLISSIVSGAMATPAPRLFQWDEASVRIWRWARRP